MLPELIKQLGKKDLDFGELLFNTLAKYGEGIVVDTIKDVTKKTIDLHNPDPKDVEIILDKKEVIEDKIDRHIENDLSKVEPPHLTDDILDSGKETVKDLIEDKTGIDLNNIQNSDLSNARELYKHIKHNKNESWFKRNFIEIFSLILLILGFSVLIGINYIDENIIDKISKANIVSFTQNALMAVIMFWLGSSYGSKDKTDIIKNKIEKYK